MIRSHREIWSRIAIVLVASWIAAAHCLAAQKKASPRPLPPGAREVKGLEAQRMLFNQRKYAEAERYGYALIWKDIRMPEELAVLGQTLEALKRTDEAAVFYTLALRAAEELEPADGKAPPAPAAKYRQVRGLAERRLKALDKPFQDLKAKYEKEASGRKFISPEGVDDGWMTQVKADLRGLHALYAWKIVGGRKDAKPDWVHNTQGAMHRSGLKHVGETDGRRGLLFATLDKPAQDKPAAADGNKAPGGRIRVNKPAGAKVLRIGAKGYGFPFILKVSAGDKELFSQKVGDKGWEDLKIDLSDERPGEITLHLSVPEGQKWHEGAWFDYVAFFPG